MTPYVSGDTPHDADRALDLFADDLERYRSGDDLRNRVHLEAGY